LTQVECHPQLQHRVRRGRRNVAYHSHNIRREEKFFTGTKRHVELTGSLSSEPFDYGQLWNYHVSNRPKEREARPSTPAFRKLFNRFVDFSNSTVNDTVTVEMKLSRSNHNESESESESVVYTSSDSNATELQPLRIRAVLAEHNETYSLTNEQRTLLFHEMLSPALLSWSSALRVAPVVGNLTVDPDQLVDGSTCGPGKDSGLPSYPVPSHHLTEGIPDTDMIVYLSLEFTFSNVTSDANSTVYEGNATIDATIGAGNLTSSIICSGSSVAAASFCSTDQYDRPTAALLHICLDEAFFDPLRIHRNVMTLKHELGHALGFNALSMAHFRRPDGSPYTPRTPEGDVPDSTIECTGPHAERRNATVALPSEEVLQFQTVRRGVRVAELVTPSVVQVVRNHFDCQNLTGAELESGEGMPLILDESGCIGNHWERRLFSGDLMNPIIDDVEYSTRISTLTLAYFADSGWYQVDLSNAEIAAGWGRGAGCNFVHDPCIGKNGEVSVANAPFFCNDLPNDHSRSVATEIRGCTADLSRKASCSIGVYDLDLPWEYQYFQQTYGSDYGGDDPFMDYCPVYLGYDNGLCSNLQNEQFVKASGIERFGVRNSRCLVGSLSQYRKTALCLPIACVIEDRSFRVQIDETWHVCDEMGQEIVSGDISVECPDPRRVCPTFYCPYDCLEYGGVCDYQSGKCLCEHENMLVGNTSAWRVCGLSVVEEEEPSKSGSGPVLRPMDEAVDDMAKPYPNSPLSDYYVDTTRALQESNGLFKPWALSLSISVLALLLALVLHRRHVRGKQTEPDNLPINRNKDKMIATVLVDMRIHHSIAETDEHLTESEANQSVQSISELSSRRSETCSEADISQGEVSKEEILQREEDEVREKEQIIRRRRLTSSVLNSC